MIITECHLILVDQQHKLKNVKNNFGKIFKGDHSYQKESHSGYKQQLVKILGVWNGNHEHDYGILRVFRLTLVSALLLFPGVLIDQLFKKSSTITRKLIVEIYVIFKTLFPVIVLVNHWFSNPWIYLLAIYFLIETYIYLFSKIFLADQHSKTSNMRTLMLLIINFLESSFTFAVIYLSGSYLNIKPDGVVDAVYYSFVTSATIGYGDIHPINFDGKLVVITQILSSVSFIVLFFNFFSGKANQQIQ